MGTIPRPPIEVRLITKRPGVGVDENYRQRIPRFTVDHSMVGTLLGTDSYFRQATTAALTDFGIGLVDRGDGYARIFQWNDYNGKQVGWASGPVRNPWGDALRVLAAFGGAAGVNQFGVSIEHDDNGNIRTPVSAAQWSSSAWLHAWLHGEELVPSQRADSFDLNIHHREFTGTDYKDCPFPRIYDYTSEFHEAIKSIMRHWQDGVPYPANGVWVAGKKLTVPVNSENGGVKPVSERVIVPGTNQEFWIIEPIYSAYVHNGGFARYGYPVSGMYTESFGEASGLIVQYFERGRLEVQPDGAITEGRIGAELYKVRTQVNKIIGE